MSKWYAIYSSILHLHFSEGFLKLPESAKAAVSPSRPVMRMLRMAGYTFVRLMGNLFKSVEKPELLQGKVWLYVVSQNNYDSLHFLKDNLPGAVFVAGQSKDIGKYNNAVIRISLRRKISYYYKFLPLYFQFLKYKKQNTLRFTDVLFDAIGFYEVYLQKVQQYKPKAIVFANDHNADARAMLLAAKAAGVKTIYIQHASVSSLFPPLEYDLNLLEGQDALDKYLQCGPITGKVELIGMPKADKFARERNEHSKIETIGVACNQLDATESIVQLVSHLAMDFPELTVILRPHPRDNRNFEKLLPGKTNITFSKGSEESSLEFLKHLDVLVSGTSGIHLEAVLLNVWAVYFNMNPHDTLEDYYSFIRNELVDVAENYVALQRMLRERLNDKPEVYRRARYYNATIGSEYDGKSSEVALKYIQDFLKV